MYICGLTWARVKYGHKSFWTAWQKCQHLLAKADEDGVAFPRIATSTIRENSQYVAAYYRSEGANPIEYLGNLQEELDGRMGMYSDLESEIRRGTVLTQIGGYEMVRLIDYTIESGELSPIATEGPVFGYVEQSFGGVELPPERRHIGDL